MTVPQKPIVAMNAETSRPDLPNDRVHCGAHIYLYLDRFRLWAQRPSRIRNSRFAFGRLPDPVNESGRNLAAKEPLPGRLGYLGKSPGLTLGQPARSSGAASASVISTVLSAPTARVGPPNGETPSEPVGGPNDHFWGLVAAG